MDALRSPSAPQAPGLRIGEVAKRTGLSVKTIRFYCDQGLLRPSGRSEGGYRLFHEDCFAELHLIRALRVMDVPLPELARILEVRRSGFCHCTSLKQSIATKITSIDERILALESMKSELLRLLESWQNCGGTVLETSSVEPSALEPFALEPTTLDSPSTPAH